MNLKLKDQDGFNHSKVYKAVADDEDAQLDDLKATSTDVNSFVNPPVSISESQEYLKAIIWNMKKIEQVPNVESKDIKDWEMKEHEETFGDMDVGLNDKFNVYGEAYHNNEKENPEENSKAVAKDLSYSSCLTCVDAEFPEAKQKRNFKKRP